MTRAPCAPAARCGDAPRCGVCRLIAKNPAFRRGFGDEWPATANPQPPKSLPGTHLKAVLDALGLKAAGCGACKAMQAKMNAWGAAGCRERRAEIEDWLRAQAAGVGWAKKLKAGAKAISAGLLLNPLDPAPGLLDEALRRAESPPPAPAGRWLDVPPPPPLRLAPSRPWALVTVVIGAEAERLFAAGGGHFYRYAHAIGADPVVLRDYAGPGGWPMGSKLGLARVLDHYAGLVYADADVLFRPKCPDLIRLTAPGAMGVYDELPHHRRRRDPLEAAHARFRAANGFPARTLTRYFNAGVMVVPRSHRAVIEAPARLWLPDAGMGRHCAEQCLANARLAESDLPVTWLPQAANTQTWITNPERAAPNAVLHYSAGGWKRKGRAEDMADMAAAHPWPAPHLYAVDETHVGMIRAELMTGRYRRVLEVGCHHGASTRAFLDALAAGAVAEVHLCEPAVTPELERLVAGTGAVLHRCRSVELLERDAAFDLALLDGDHSEATVAEELRRLVAAGVPTVIAHDVGPAARARYGVAGGPALVEPVLRAAGYAVTIDDTTRPGERTERGLLIARRHVEPA